MRFAGVGLAVCGGELPGVLLRAAAVVCEDDRFGRGRNALPGTPGRRPSVVGNTHDALRLPDGNHPRGASLIFDSVPKPEGCLTTVKGKMLGGYIAYESLPTF